MKIFDSATHPTISQSWLNPRFNIFSGMQQLQDEMFRFDIYKAFAIGLEGVGGYSSKSYVEFVRPHENLIPIAFAGINDDAETLFHLKKIGYKGIKIHPRLLHVSIDDARIFRLIKDANDLGLIVIYCGFLGVTSRLLKGIEDLKLLFLHTGGRDCVSTFNALKDMPNILCDFSYTLGYEDLQHDIKNICNNYPAKVCVGSDHPEIGMKELREKFEFFVEELDKASKQQIAYVNLENFCASFNT